MLSDSAQLKTNVKSDMTHCIEHENNEVVKGV